MSEVVLSESVCASIDQCLAKFPKDQKRSAVLMALRAVQDEYGYLREDLLRAVATYLDLAFIDVCEVASFYSMYRHQAVGRHVIKVCTSLSCCLRGAHQVIRHIEKALGIRLGETTSDGAITLAEAECLAACTGAPMLIVDDRDYHLDLNPESIKVLLERLQEKDDEQS